MTDQNNNTWASTDTIHSDLLAAKTFVYNLCRFDCSTPLPEAQNAEYGAYVFRLNGVLTRFRVAKITPTKVGWQKSHTRLPALGWDNKSSGS